VSLPLHLDLNHNATILAWQDIKQEKEYPAPMSIRKRWFLLPITAIALAASFWYYTRPAPVMVKLATVSRDTVEATVSNTRAGTVIACRRAKLSPSLGGQIATLDIHEGDEVKQGQLLLELWNEDLRAQLEHANSSAKAARSQTTAACLRADLAERDASRLSKLRQSGAVSVESVDKADSNAKSLRAECQAARASQTVSDAQIAIAEANLERTRLYAPFNGVIAEINGELNEYVTPSPVGVATPPAIDLIDNGCFYVSAPIDEVDAAEIRIGLPTRISLDAYPDRPFAGKVRRIADYVLDREKQARTVDVEVDFENAEDLKLLLAGYSADTEIIIRTNENTVQIPTEAIFETNQVYVFLPESGTLEKRTLKLGISNWDRSEVLEGLQPDEQIVTSLDREGVKDGAAVTPE
jgi:HlyD family secretion protein